jgi:hypothetical protein
MQSTPTSRLVQHDSGLWEASAVLDGQELHFGFFFERAEAERTLDAAVVRLGGRPADPEEA